MSERIEIQCRTITDCGLYKRGAKQPFSLPLAEVMPLLHEWAVEVGDFTRTKRCEGSDGGQAGAVYLLDIAQEGEDYLVVLLVESEVVNGKTIQLTPGGSLGEFTVAERSVDQGAVVGRPVYLWVIPSENMVASVRIRGRSNGLNDFARYMRSFLKLNAPEAVYEPGGSVEERVLVGYDLGDGETSTLYPRFEIVQAFEDPNIDVLVGNLANITHIERKINLRTVPSQAATIEKFQNLLGMVMRAARIGDDDSPQRMRVHVRMKIVATEEEIRQAAQSLKDSVDPEDNTGYFVKSLGRTVWLRGAKVVENVSFALPDAPGGCHRAGEILSRVRRHRAGILRRLRQPDEEEDGAE